MMKNLNLTVVLLSFAFLFTTKSTYAQFVVEPFVSDDAFILESWYFNTIDKSKRFSIFSLNEATYDFDTKNSSVLSYGLVGFDLVKGFGPVTGWRISPYSAAALVGLQYGIYSQNFLAYLTVNTELKDNPNYEFYALLQYRKPISKKLKLFSQLQISKNFSKDTHTFSLYRFRLGPDLGKFQAGIGIEQTLVEEDWEHDISPGLFLRLELY